MALPTKEEEALIETFRQRVADILSEDEASDDMYLIRWLRARDLDLGKAEEMIRKNMQWRQDNNLDDDIIEKPKIDSYYYENFPMYIDGMDKEGKLVLTAPFGKWDIRKVVKLGKSQEFISYLTDCFERCISAIKRCREMHPPEAGHPPISQLIAIYDWQGFAWGQLLSYQSVQNLLQIGSLYEAYYPEILHSCYFVNCPSLISSVMVLIKPVLAPKTMNKIKCFGCDKEAWTKELLQIIDADQLRPQFGGTKNDDINPFL